MDKYDNPYHGSASVDGNTVNKLKKNGRLLFRIDQVKTVSHFHLLKKL